MLKPYQQLRTIKLDSPVLAIGLMSGTSMDAIDAALVSIAPCGDPRIKLIAYQETIIPSQLRRRLKEAIDPQRSNVELICQLNFEMGELFAEAALGVASMVDIDMNTVDFIGSHGQTISHIPITDASRAWRTPSTLQIGDPCVIAEKTGVMTVGDFRVSDMAAGGIGAPLIPFVDGFLFAQNDKDVICQNIGGIANCTLIQKNGDILAFDSGPGNMVMDLIVQKMEQGMYYDDNGALAKQGGIIPQLLETSLKHPYFDRIPPKATGHEDFGEQFVQQFLSQGKGKPLKDILATACELTAQSITDAYRRFIFPNGSPKECIVSGGGLKNGFLMQRLQTLCPALRWQSIDKYGVSSDAKEAIGFAILAFSTLSGIPANIPQVTGASKPVVLGKIAPGQRGRITFAPSPNEWLKDELSKYIEISYRNCIATFHNNIEIFSLYERIDLIFRKISEIEFIDDIFPLFHGRCHFAFMTAAKLTFSGQVTESYMVARGCIENALYGLYAYKNYEISKIWVEREKDDETKKACRNIFSYSKVKKHLENSDKKLSEIVSYLYDTAIDYGAHPNADGHLLSSTLVGSEGENIILMAGTPQWYACLKILSEIAICCIKIFEIVLREKFCEKNIPQQMHEIINLHTSLFHEISQRLKNSDSSRK